MDEVEMYEHKSATEQFQTISPNDCLCKPTNGWTPWVLDVRLQTENDIVALPFTDRVSPHRTVSVRDVPVTGDILVYCKAGVRGQKLCFCWIGLESVCKCLSSEKYVLCLSFLIAQKHLIALMIVDLDFE